MSKAALRGATQNSEERFFFLYCLWAASLLNCTCRKVQGWQSCYKQEKLKCIQQPHRKASGKGGTGEGGQGRWAEKTASSFSILCRSAVTDGRSGLAVYELLADADIRLKAWTARFLLVCFCFDWILEAFLWITTYSFSKHINVLAGFALHV